MVGFVVVVACAAFYVAALLVGAVDELERVRAAHLAVARHPHDAQVLRLAWSVAPTVAVAAPRPSAPVEPVVGVHSERGHEGLTSNRPDGARAARRPEVPPILRHRVTAPGAVVRAVGVPPLMRPRRVVLPAERAHEGAHDVRRALRLRLPTVLVARPD